MPSTPFQAQLLAGQNLANIGRKADGTETPQRAGRYSEGYVLSLMPTKHLLAEEGSYYNSNNGSNGVATAAAPTVFSSTNPFLLLFNQEAVGGKNIELDYITLVNAAPGTGGTNLQCAVTVDAGNRFSAGGVSLTPANVNPAIAGGSVAKVWAGNITATAATISARGVVGVRTLKGSIPVSGDVYTARFGSADAPDLLSVSTVTLTTINLPPIIVPPQYSVLFYIWLAAQSVSSSFAPEIGWWER